VLTSRLAPGEHIRVLKLVSVLAIGLGSAYVAYAQASPYTFYACLRGTGALVKVSITGAPTCRAGQTLATWNQVGPPGPGGPGRADRSRRADGPHRSRGPAGISTATLGFTTAPVGLLDGGGFGEVLSKPLPAGSWAIGAADCPPPRGPLGEWTASWSSTGVAPDHVHAPALRRRRSGVLPTEHFERPVDGERWHPAGIGRVGIRDPRIPAAQQVGAVVQGVAGGHLPAVPRPGIWRVVTFQ
jgi:hypothetical protein